MRDENISNEFFLRKCSFEALTDKIMISIRFSLELRLNCIKNTILSIIGKYFESMLVLLLSWCSSYRFEYQEHEMPEFTNYSFALTPLFFLFIVLKNILKIPFCISLCLQA